jgi:glycosyltransferase involved in cell wall biosynthesis
MLHAVTPVILTYNEAPNIGRTLERLPWATDIVVVDSGSTDATLEVLSDTPGVRIFFRPFDTHANQWRYAIDETGILTPWILRLDADYQVPEELAEEISMLDPDHLVGGYRAKFDYLIGGHKLRSSLYPPKTILLRRGRFEIEQDGHTEAWKVSGVTRTLRAHAVHDDRKGIDRWLAAQVRYMELERKKAETRHPLREWLRAHPPLMPFAVFLYCLFVRGLIFNGRAGLYYAMQRMIAEAIFSLMLLESRTGEAP